LVTEYYSGIFFLKSTQADKTNWQHFFKNLFITCIVICRQTLIGLNYTKFSIQFFPLSSLFISPCLEVCTKYYHTKNNLQINAEQPPFGSDNVTTYTKDLTIDIQDPGHTLFPTEIQYTRTSDDIRICDFTCLPNLIIATNQLPI